MEKYANMCKYTQHIDYKLSTTYINKYNMVNIYTTCINKYNIDIKVSRRTYMNKYNMDN